MKNDVASGTPLPTGENTAVLQTQATACVVEDFLDSLTTRGIYPLIVSRVATAFTFFKKCKYIYIFFKLAIIKKSLKK